MINPGLLIALLALAVAIYAVWCCARANRAMERRVEQRIDELSTKVGALTRKAEEAIQIGNEALEVQRQWREIDRQDRPKP